MYFRFMTPVIAMRTLAHDKYTGTEINSVSKKLLSLASVRAGTLRGACEQIASKRLQFVRGENNKPAGEVVHYSCARTA